jgi:predicted alpha/beta-hydrolase family hydrolase
LSDLSVSTLRYEALNPTGAMLVLAHGAGAGHRHPFMVAVARGLAERGIDVVTFNFPYMEQRRKVPDKAPVLEACFRDVIEEIFRHRAEEGRLFIGGKSMGGRMATHLGAQGLPGLRGIIALGYPLHPPGRPDQPRVAHLPSIEVPVLIVQGERDAFGTPAELAPVIATMRAAVTLHVVQGGDHSLAVRGQKPDDTRGPVLDAIATWIRRVN